jgi:hypothetical protein
LRLVNLKVDHQIKVLRWLTLLRNTQLEDLVKIFNIKVLELVQN